MRGKLRDGFNQAMRMRIIPARAGQTDSIKIRNPLVPDHPRACGANVDSRDGVLVVAGSSPRVRGKLVGRPHPVIIRRIIPARAGQTPSFDNSYTLRADHPRACGANVGFRRTHVVQVGSSPRVRGKLGFRRTHVVQVRIIPARAGQTPAAGSPPHPPQDHPRACGANSPILCENS